MTVTAVALLAAASALLLAGGALKVVEPTRTAGALVALGWPASPALVRAAAAGEAALGAVGLIVGGPAVAGLVGASYLGFAVFVVAALCSGRPVGTCGCFAREDTPPRLVHVAVDVAMAAGAAFAAVVDPVPLVDGAIPAWPLAAALAAAGYLALTAGAGPPGSPTVSAHRSHSGSALTEPFGTGRDRGLRARDPSPPP